MSNGLESTAELNKLLTQQNKIYAAQTKIMKGQLMLIKNMAEALGQVPAEETSKSFEEMNAAIQEADKALENFTKTGQGKLGSINDTIKNGAKNANDFGKQLEFIGKKSTAFAVILTTLEGIPAGFKLSVSIAKTFIGTVTTLIGSLKDLAFSIISVPFKILNALMDYAANTSGAELRRQIEEVRDQFGTLAKNEGQAVIKTFRNMQGTLAETGLPIRRVLGYLAERLQAVRELAVKLGRQFTIMQDEFMKHGERIVAYEKGLGLTEEGIKNVAAAATATGKDFIEVGREITTYAYQMGDAFGINGKMISRDVGEMIGDFENFGSVGVKTMTQVAIFTRKLGIEVKDLLGIIGKFDDFEQAAQSAAQLSQAFGLNIDALEMLKEQDPAARFDKLRKAFALTGRSVEHMNRQELKLLSTQTGLDAKTLKLGLSAKGMGQSYEQIQKQGDATEKKQLSQAEAMKELADSIKFLVKEGQRMKGGFFDIFVQGFEYGIERSGEFRRTIWTLRRAMRTTFIAGRQVGQMFMKMFPGVKQMFEGLRAFFDPKIFGKFTRKGKVTGLMGEIVKMFREFFKLMTTDPKIALKSLMENLQKNFFNFFQKEAAPGRKILSGFKTFLETIAGLFTSFADMAMKGMTQVFIRIAEAIADPDKVIAGGGTATKGFLGWLEKTLFIPMLKVWEKNKEPLFKAIKNLFDTVWEKIKPTVMEYGEKIAWWLLKGYVAITAASMFVRGFMAATTKFLFDGVGKALNKGTFEIRKRFVGFLSNTFVGGAEQASKTVTPKISKAMGPLIQGATGNIGQAAAGTRGMTTSSIRATGGKLLAIGGALALGGVAIAGAIWAMRKALKGATVTEIMGVLAALSASFIGIAAMAPAMKALSVVPWGAIGAGLGKATVGIAALGAVSVIMAGNILLLKGILGGIQEADIQKILKVMGSMATLYIGAGVILIEAALVGTAIISTFGVGGAAMVAGLGTIAIVVQAMAEQTMLIMKKLDGISLSPGFERKMEAFTNIFKSIIDFTGVIANLMSIAKTSIIGSIVSIFTKRPEPTIKQTLGIVQSIIKALGGSIKGIIQELTQATRGITPEQLAGGEMIASLLAGIASLASALQPPAGVTGGSSWLGDYVAQFLKTDHLLAASDYITKVSGVLKNLIPTMITLLKQIGLMPNVDSDKVNVFTTFTRGVANILQALKQMTETTGGGGTGLWTDIKTGYGKLFDGIGGLFQAEEAGGAKITRAPGNAGENPMLKAIKSLTQVFVGPGGILELFRKFADKTTPFFNNELPVFLEQVDKSVKMIGQGEVLRVTGGIKDIVAKFNGIKDDLNSLGVLQPKMINTKLTGMAQKLGLTGKESLELNLSDINIKIEVGVNLLVDEIEKGLSTKPGKSEFAFVRRTR